MFDKHYIGQNAAGITAATQFDPITKIVLLVDDENAYVAGNDTGRALEMTCPYGSQAMANALLAQLSGYTYRPMTAQDALLDPAAELGDGVTVGGVYTVLAEMDTLFDMHCAADIAAPGEDELESEYTYQSPEKRLERQLAQTRSLIAKTAAEIALSVESISEEVSSLAEIALTAENITLSVSNKSSSSTITLKAGDTTISSETIRFSGVVTFGDLDDPDSGTVINGALLETGTVVASHIRGETVTLLDDSGDGAGELTLTTASSAGYAVALSSYGALRLSSDSGGAIALETDDNALYLSRAGITVDDHFYPTSDGAYRLGDPDFLWSDVYAENSTIQTSDRNRKNSIRYGLDHLNTFFDGLQPAVFKLNDGSSGRDHVGLISQDVEENLTSCDLTGTDFAGFVKFQKRDGSDGYALRYGEFIGLLIDQVQKIKARMAALEGAKHG